MLYGLTKNQLIPNANDNRINGKAVRDKIPFSAHAVFTPVNRDPVAIINEQNQNRLPDLLALRKERMSVSPFTYYRGTAIIMANRSGQSNGYGFSTCYLWRCPYQ